MKIEIGKTYVDRAGNGIYIMGEAKHPPIDGHVVLWSLQADWYLDDGRVVGYDADAGAHYVPEDKLRELVKEIETPDCHRGLAESRKERA